VTSRDRLAPSSRSVRTRADAGTKRLPFAPAALAVLTALLPLSVSAHDVRVRRPLRLPRVAGFLALQCDLHTHTVFSDGLVWPDVRSEEAWREGLDAIAITDHVEYLPHRRDLPPNLERSWEIAAPLGEKLGLVVVKGSEVTRKMPPGHFNALFLRDVCPLETPDWRDALRAARSQGAFLVWNHPAWRGHQKDGVARWYPEHDELLREGLLDAIEVVNERVYSPEAHRWAIEKGLAVVAGSDVHEPTGLSWLVHEGDRRPVTLVFAKGRGEEAIREALLARRTAALGGGTLVGSADLLGPLVDAALEVENPKVAIRAGSSAWLRVRNDSGLRLVLSGPGEAGGLSTQREVVIAADGTSLVELSVPKGATPGLRSVPLPFTVTNAKVTPEEGLEIAFAVDVEILPPTP